MPDMAYVNGEFVPLAEARISVNDRGVYFADAVYEVCITYGGKVFLLNEHFDRLERSLRGVRINYAVDRQFLADLLYEGIRRSGYQETLIYLQVGRAIAQRDRQFPDKTKPTLMLTFREKPRIAPDKRERGLEAILVPDERWGHCHYKTTMLLPNVLAYQKALDSGKDDAIFYDSQTRTVREATAANVFIAQGDRLATPEENAKMLSGTVRRYVIDLARQNGLELDERPVAVDELLAADEVFLTGTTTEVMAVVRVDDRPIGKGAPGALTRR
ncbi:hypothetical protein AMJ85_10080, partial [candidate division BRC1 bacterium SM23_51]